MVAFASVVRKWHDPAAEVPPKDGSPFMAEDADGEAVVVEWRDEKWVMGRTSDGGWIALSKPIARWRHLE